MYYVYFLRSTSSPDQTYIGFSKDLKKRIAARRIQAHFQVSAMDVGHLLRVFGGRRGAKF
jgi:predicted GIY-YIG superfamily endonuclease